MRPRVAVLLLMGSLWAAAAQVPVRTEQLIYSVLAFSGADYSPTMVPQSSDTIYLMAGTSSFLAVRKAMVYWWPLTREWRLDTETLNVPLAGDLEIIDREGVMRSIPASHYTYFRIQSPHGQSWRVVSGAQAQEVFEGFVESVLVYQGEVQTYQQGLARYEAELEEIAGRVRTAREAGQDVTALIEQAGAIPLPVAPRPPQTYATPPVAPQEGIVVSLEPGTYRVRVRAPDGTVLEGSDKMLVAHARRRSDAIGYDIIPADKWTRPIESSTPTAVLYVSGTADIYLRPFLEDELNELAYRRTIDNGATGNAHVYTWVRTQQVSQHTIRVIPRGSPPLEVAEQPFVVEQTQGSASGYRIVPYEPRTAHRGLTPDIVAYRVSAGGPGEMTRILLVNPDGTPKQGGERVIRTVNRPAARWAYLGLAILPLAVPLILWRRRAHPGSR